MDGKIDLNGVERKLDKIADNLHKPFEDMDTRNRHREMIETQNKHHKELIVLQNEHNRKMLAEQKELSKWTKILAIATMILVIGSISVTLYVNYTQKPKPILLLNVDTPVGIKSNDPYGPHVKIANTGTRTAFNTKLIVSYEKENSFYTAYFIKYNATVSRINPNFDSWWVYPQEAVILGLPYWIVNKKSTYIFLNEIEPGESIDLMVKFVGKCGEVKNINFELYEEGYSVHSGVKSSQITWNC